jgi:hypothetical protein
MTNHPKHEAKSATAQQIERSASKKLCVYHAHQVAFPATS